MNLQKTVTFLRQSVSFIRQHIVLRNLILALMILLAGTFIIIQTLKIVTRHSYAISVPYFTGLTLEDAVVTARERDLRIEVLDSVYLNDFERGTVVDQHPKPGFKVKKNRKIFLTMNAVKPEKVVVPNLIDLTFRQARARLESFGLVVGNISYAPDIAINIVLAQKSHGRDLIPGDSVIKGSAVDIVLGKGLSEEETSVPDLIGYTFDEAQVVASDRFLSIGAVVPDNTILTEEDRASALIFRQRPEAGGEEKLLMGSSIDIWLTLDSAKVAKARPMADTITISQ